MSTVVDVVARAVAGLPVTVTVHGWALLVVLALGACTVADIVLAVVVAPRYIRRWRRGPAARPARNVRERESSR